MRFFRDSFLTFCTLGLLFLLGVVSSILTARFLGPEGRGILGMVLLLPATCATLGSLGVGAANAYLLRRGEGSINTLLANSLLAALAITTAAGIAVTIAWPWLSSTVMPGISPWTAAIGLLSLPVILVTDFLLGLLLGCQRLLRYNAAPLAGKVLSLAALVFALVYLRAGVKGAVLAGLFGSLLTLALVWRALQGIPGASLWPIRLDGQTFRRTLSYGLREHVGNLMMFMAYRLDVFILAALTGMVEVGLYGIAVTMAESFFHLPDAVGRVLFPHLARQERSGVGRDAARACRIASSTVLLSAVVAIPLATPAVRIAYSSAFLPAAQAFLALLPGIYALSVSKVLASYFTGGLGRPLLNAKAQAAAFVVNVSLNLLLIPAYGIVGAAIASSAAYTAHALVTLFLFRRFSGVPIRQALLVQSEDLAWLWLRVRALQSKGWKERHA